LVQIDQTVIFGLVTWDRVMFITEY